MSDPENKDIRELVKTVQSDLPEVNTSSILNETSIVSAINESSILNEHPSMLPDTSILDSTKKTPIKQSDTTKQVFKDATPFLNSILSNSSIISDDSFVVSRRQGSAIKDSIIGDSFIDSHSNHTSFFNSNESSFIIPSVVPHRRSIRESQYNSLLMPDSKRVSSYDSLLRTSDEFTKLPNTYNSLFTGLTSHENSMISSSENSSGMISSPHNLSHLSNRLSEFNQKQKSFLSDETTISGTSESSIQSSHLQPSPLDQSHSFLKENSTISTDHSIPQEDENTVLSSQSNIEKEKEMSEEEHHREEEKDVSKQEQEMSEEEQEEQEEEKQEMSEEQEEQEHEEEQEEEEQQEQEMSEEEQEEEQQEQEMSEEEEQEEQEQEEQEQEQEEQEQEQEDHSLNAAEEQSEQKQNSDDSFLSDIPNNFSNEELPPSLSSVEEDAINRLLLPSQESQSNSILNDTLMPPPKAPLSKMIIPSRNLKLGRKKGSKGKEDVCMPQNLIKKIVSSSTNRKVDKNAYDAIDLISHDFFDMISDRLDDYCHLGKRNTVNVSDVILLMKRQRILKNGISFEELVREHLNKQQIDTLITIPEWQAKMSDLTNYLK